MGQRLGVHPGDSVAVLGQGFYAYWARLGRVKIVAEVPDAQEVWSASAETRGRRPQRPLSRTGAKMVVTKDVPPDANEPGWIRIGTTEYSAHPLNE